MIDVETARTYYQENDAAHDFDHVLRVWQLAEKIGQIEGADMEILQAAALLHDVGRAEQQRTGVSHATWGAEAARRILSEHPAERVEAVAQAIGSHRFRDDNPPQSLEAQILFDADKLDAIGAIGIARAYAIAGDRHQRLWSEVDPDYAERMPSEGGDDLNAANHTPVHEFRFKLGRLKDRMLTTTGRRLAEGRHRFMVSYFERLEREVKGEA